MILRKEDITVEIGFSSTVDLPLLSALTIARNASFNILLPISFSLSLHHKTPNSCSTKGFPSMVFQIFQLTTRGIFKPNSLLGLYSSYLGHNFPSPLPSHITFLLFCSNMNFFFPKINIFNLKMTRFQGMVGSNQLFMNPTFTIKGEYHVYIFFIYDINI